MSIYIEAEKDSYNSRNSVYGGAQPIRPRNFASCREYVAPGHDLVVCQISLIQYSAYDVK
jgi:hypothetical protein